MVHASDTGVADGAMMSSRRLDLLALVTVSKSDVRSDMRMKMIINRILNLLPGYLYSTFLLQPLLNILAIARFSSILTIFLFIT